MNRLVLVSSLALTLLAGCASDGVLELTLDLPPAPGGERIYVFTQARDATDNPILDEWRDDADLDGVELGTARTQDHISLRSARDGIDVNVKLTFCSTVRCSTLEDSNAPQLLYTLRTPVYVGQRTSYTLRVAAVPTTRDPSVTVIDKCDIAGCVGGELRSYCRADGTHFCE
ncbi:MAG: hypothetical protein GXP55_24980 [Deltaproteobacteria bacterium]|nr:hypothetical protein [Deltaproteobacteria bacterium]